MSKTILVAPLNWGIGHACRSIPIINFLLHLNYKVIIASDGEALLLLKKEFPQLVFEELPSYNITYSKQKKDFKSHLIKQLPKIYNTIKAEHKATKRIAKKHNIDGVISDNRLGVYYKKRPSIFITHQLNVLSGNTTFISSKLHEHFIKKFNECWIPDFENAPNLSGKLSHNDKIKHPIPTKFIGALSRFEKSNNKIEYDLMVLLSGPEPQRSILEDKLKKQLKRYDGNTLFVKGKIEDEQEIISSGKLTECNYLTSKELERCMNRSQLILCRSGYTTLMDLAKLEKKAFFIPTPGQFEQEYLAEHLDKQNIAPFANQDDFDISLLTQTESYLGFSKLNFKDLNESLLSCFV